MKQLTVRERTCLLRAARTTLYRLYRDFDTLTELGIFGPQRALVAAEITLMLSSISWLWSQVAIDD